ncbi:MAG: ribosome maturation factor RimM [Oceanicaulis sp.]
MTKRELVVIGAIAGAHGVKGEARIKAFGDAGAVCTYGAFLDETGAVLLTPVRARPGPNGLVVASFKERRSREEIQAMKSTKLYVPRDSLPELEEDEFYYADLVGLPVEDLEGAALGKVKAIQDYGAGDILEVAGPGGTLLIPFTREAVPHVDVKTGKLVADPPEVDDEDGGEGAPG